jgi:hypothetical protein
VHPRSPVSSLVLSLVVNDVQDLMVIDIVHSAEGNGGSWGLKTEVPGVIEWIGHGNHQRDAGRNDRDPKFRTGVRG